jgi:hypothetical protein
MSAPEYYIVVKKDTSGKFDIIDDLNKLPNGKNPDTSNTPSELIKNTSNLYIPIQVIEAGTDNDNVFDVDGVKYKLVMNSIFDTTKMTNPTFIGVVGEFNKMHQAFSASSAQTVNTNNNSNNNNNNNNNSANTSAPPTASTTASNNISPPPPGNPASATPSVSTPNSLNELKSLVRNATTDILDNQIDGTRVRIYNSRNDAISGDHDFIILNNEMLTDEILVGNTTYEIQASNQNNNIKLFKKTGATYGGQKQKQRRSKRNYSKKQRKQWAKNNTLRNYFNYRESAP